MRIEDRRSRTATFGGISAAFVVILLSIASAHAQDSAQTPQTKYVRVDDAELHYIEMGRGEPVVLIHGILDDADSWGRVAGELAKRFHVIAYSLRYHFPNPPPSDRVGYFGQMHTIDLAALLKELRLGPAHLVGYSYGAGVAVEVALQFPSLVKSLVLIEGGILPPGDHATLLGSERMMWFHAADRRLSAGDSLGAVRVLVQWMSGDSLAFRGLPPSAIRRMVRNLPAFKAMLDAAPNPLPTTCDKLHTLEIPVLMVEGERSPKYFHSLVAAMHECIPGARRVIVPGATHLMLTQDPSGVDRVVTEFLGSFR